MTQKTPFLSRRNPRSKPKDPYQPKVLLFVSRKLPIDPMLEQNPKRAAEVPKTDDKKPVPEGILSFR